jgi:vacuolar protein sorting-associated protein 13A/C
MAKRLLLNVLLSVLGDYIEGLSEDNLKLGVWSGEISLNNLHLNRTILQRLNLPVVIAHGSVKSLHVQIPWATLESNPLKIRIDGVFLQIGPLNLSKLDAEELTVRALAVKQLKLQEIDRIYERVAAEAHAASGQDGKNSSYWQRLTTKIVDNIEITLTNLHVRYEDSMTIPGRCFSFGVTLDTFSLTTRDKDWRESFVSRVNVFISISTQIPQLIPQTLYLLIYRTRRFTNR